ncbi:Xaa-Pro dipeptidyl-peptidase [Saccharomonospora sp. CUA-673]|uniref:Xaa-Pro dipeptidyl-peptidase n=1 Tax=Saccharomonospora sp. CUA-673 TaxID=1904969 RepID=UPI000963AAA4|nr:Xaa-Pro dipeptidyl-peptidase [Saccharomonospora sp. CUA-673]OLT48607.1 Xaa-Pro dipeptidyl-peptidase [Saccharomonospora sp. CUA-673]
MRSRRLVPVLAPLLAAVVAVPLTAPAVQASPVDRPVFEGGAAQPVFDPSDVVRDELWVRAPVDSDGDGADDEVHVQVVRPKATEHGLDVPVVYTASPYFAGGNEVENHNVDVELYVPRAQMSTVYEEYLLARGFAVVYADSLGTGGSTGCPTTGGENETIGAKSVVDWLNGRADARTESGEAIEADWTTGKTAMMGVSYNGTLPNAVAGTGVEGLETIVPIAAISEWYGYYRENGTVVAPGGYQGEDADVLAEYVYTRQDREICRPVIDELAERQDRITGDDSEFWQERSYLDKAENVRASVLAVHGLDDWNVKVAQTAQWYEALAEHGVDRKIWLHQFDHTDPYRVHRDAWLQTLNRWFSHYLYGIDNGIDREPRATIQREDETWHDEADWPAPGAADVTLHPRPGGEGVGGLTPGGHAPGRPVVESLTDDATEKVEDLVDADASPHRLRYATEPAADAVRLSGTPSVDLRVAFDRPAANVTGVLVDRAPDGTAHVITRGHADPQNRHDRAETTPIRPGKDYRLSFDLQPQDYILQAGHRLEFVALSSDHDFTLRPEPGAGIAMNVKHSSVTVPVVGGAEAVRVGG